ncbi:MAG: pantoate--beta-alanine ligase [Actinobacteria bacterium]|nr:pantoate--beta-alanine ligase [Actinomycetota bacterium]
MWSRYGEWSLPGPVGTISTVGRSSSIGPFRRSFAPSTSTNSLTPSTSTRIRRGTLSAPGTRQGLEHHHVRRRHGHRRRPRRHDHRRPSARARRRRAPGRRAPTPVRARPRDRRRGPVDPGGAVGRPRLRRDPARRARPPLPPLLRAPAADAVARRRPDAARRRLGRRHVRGRGCGGTRALARRDARAAAVPPRGRPARALPRGRRRRLQLPRHALPRRGRARPRGGGAGRGARPVDDAHDRERLRADGADRARRPGDDRTPSRCAAGHGARAAVRRAGRGDAAVIVVRSTVELDLPRHGVVGLVPTMGALHEGHAALFRSGRAASDVLVASLFVNPAQFAEQADLARYPRDLDRDAAFAAEHGVDVLFAPSADEMYPPGYATWVEPAGAAVGLEGAHRPGHFRGVATVCLKLFNLVRPQIAWFGRKDAQQVAVVQQLVRDLNVPVEIRVVETVRDRDGLAVSSRNARLSPSERDRARAIPRALATGDPGEARAVLEASGLVPDYVEVADLDGPTLLVAARIGETRLIDNVRLRQPEGENR